MSAAVGAAVAAGAAARASANARARCIEDMDSFQHSGATVAEIRHYADCADRIYPDGMSGEQLLASKAAVLFMFAAAIIGAVYECRAGNMASSWLGGIAIGSILGALVGLVTLLVGVMIYGGVQILMG